MENMRIERYLDPKEGKAQESGENSVLEVSH
jgi:hypothetical protein